MKTAVLESHWYAPVQAAPVRSPLLRVAAGGDRLPKSQRIHLTPRQREVLALLCEGLPNKLICRRLNISAGTVKAHISSILRELGVSTRLQAVVLARSAGLLEEDDTEVSCGGNERR